MQLKNKRKQLNTLSQLNKRLWHTFAGLLMLATANAALAFSDPPPANAVQCATEWSGCNFAANEIATVWFGTETSGNWFVQTGVQYYIGCSEASFGGIDPDPGVSKVCKYIITSTTPPQSNVAPTVSITSPVNNATAPAPASVTITADASDSDGTIAQVEFYANGSQIGVDLTAPYSGDVTNVPAGTYHLTAIARDNDGAATTSSVVTVVVTAAGSNVAPSTSITAPANNATAIAPATFSITANATDTDGTIAQVEFFAGGNSLGTDTVAPYSIDWTNVAAGSYNITTVATDDDGATTTSTAIAVTVTEPANVAPSTSITAPANNASYTAPASISITANAADTDGTITQVVFYEGTNLLSTDTTVPYAVELNNVIAGTYTFTTVATDEDGATTTSAPVQVTVNVATPTTPQAYFIHTDHLNTPRLITDASNNKVWEWNSNDPFGNNVPNADPNNTGSNFTYNPRFPGQYFDAETNLSYNYFRDYDPSTGRYIQSDPIGLAGGINTYGYVLGNPIAWVDRLGLDVYLCRQPAFGYLPVDHQWLKTDTVEAGMGGTRGNVPGNESGDELGDPVQVTNHAGRSKQKGSSCTLVEDVDENVVNDELIIGRKIGEWGFRNHCQSFANDVLTKGRRTVSGTISK